MGSGEPGKAQHHQMRLLTRLFTAVAGVLAMLATLLVLVAAPAAAHDTDVIVFEGGGWGHSVGMSQYGALGFARDGWDYTQIISHYYSEYGQNAQRAYVAALEGAGNLRVNLTQERIAVELYNRGSFPVTITRDAESYVVDQNNTKIEIVSDGPNCRVLAGGAEALPSGSCRMTLTWDGWEEQPTTRIEMPWVTSRSGSRIQCQQRDWNVGFDRVCAYSRGTMHIWPDNNTDSFHVVQEMDLDQYAYGISEMPYYWGRVGGDWSNIDPKGLEALKVQAVAARSYALRRAIDAGPSRLQVCGCHVYDTTVDQRYVGWGHGQAPWIKAVDDTSMQVVGHPASVDSKGDFLPVPAYYSSSTFGATEPNEVGFGSSNPVPYLRSVPDPHSADPNLNGNARWTVSLTKAQIAAKLGMSKVTGVTVETWSPSGAAWKVRFHGSPDKVVDSRLLRGKLGLKSPQIAKITDHGHNPPPPPPPPIDPPGPHDPVPETVGVHDPRTGIFSLHRDGTAPLDFYFGNPLDMPYAGDWNCDGVTTLGLYRVSTGFLFLRNSNTQGIADINIYYGNPGDLPIAGDWNGNGCETVGIFRPSEGRFYLRNSNTQGVGDLSLEFGQAGDVPVAGDWDGDGDDTIGVYRPSNKTLYLSNSVTEPNVDFQWVYSGAEAGDKIIVGDWDGDGVDTVGVFRPSQNLFYLRDTYTQSGANIEIELGKGHMTPVAGYWG